MRACALLGLLIAAPSLAAKAPEPRPKLVVALVIDQLRASDVARHAPLFSGGFKRLLQSGAVLTGHYGHQNTYTGPGHALILSGSYGYLNGVVQNKWFNRQSGRSEGMLFDPESKPLIGSVEPGDDISPRNFIGTTVGDELRLATRMAAKTVSVSLKERGAILLGGRLGQAWFFAEASGDMTTSTYYLPSPPKWVDAFNARKLADQSFGKKWERTLPAAAYATCAPDDSPHEGDVLGLGRTFPHPITGGIDKPGQKFYEAFATTPLGIDYQLDFARAAVEGEQLGGRGVTDLLAISISSTDLIGHTYGLYSQETLDALLRADRAIGALLTYLDGRLGRDGYLVMWTADHGAMPPPEESARFGLPAYRIKKAAMKSAITAALDARFGRGDWVVALEDPSVYLDGKLIGERKLDRAEVERVAGEALLAVPGFVGYFTRSQLMNGWLPPTEGARAVARSFHPQRSGDVIAIQAPFSFWGKYGEKDYGGSHGSYYRYDTDVPLVFAGPQFRPGRYGVVEQVDAAATLSWLLDLPAPAGCEGRPLLPILKSTPLR